MSIEQLIYMNSGFTKEEAEEQINLNKHLYENSAKYSLLPVEQWPEIKFNWDTSKNSQKYSMDGQIKGDFNKNYPQGFLLGYVELACLDKILCDYCFRDKGEVWSCGSKDSLARAILYISEYRPISPPVVKPWGYNEDWYNEKVGFSGGNHRYAIAKEIGLINLPIYVLAEDKKEIDRLLKVNWA